MQDPPLLLSLEQLRYVAVELVIGRSDPSDVGQLGPASRSSTTGSDASTARPRLDSGVRASA